MRGGCSRLVDPLSDSRRSGERAFTVAWALSLIGFASIDAFVSWSYTATDEQVASVVTALIVMLGT
ncbi:MAG TPA: hypothetical protein PKC43_02725 [Phycisphaerales bacterium]|nr:hypothetical protein [Phycisphaerales bacterium]HMP36340.1 hypothetical protein [Phycisphaerales bacterium]